MKTITVCGSGKFKSYVHEVCANLEQLGFVVFMPPLHDIEALSKTTSEEGKLLIWKGATHAHFKRIDIADICLIVNPGGYVGNSTTLELGYAVAKNKIIISLSPDNNEMSRQGLIDFVLNEENPYNIARKLKDMFSDKIFE